TPFSSSLFSLSTSHQHQVPPNHQPTTDHQPPTTNHQQPPCSEARSHRSFSLFHSHFRTGQWHHPRPPRRKRTTHGLHEADTATHTHRPRPPSPIVVARHQASVVPAARCSTAISVAPCSRL
ncbi:hypothetical protein PIB30_082664, partial [Stylosanthes scabra]|nr:hypothetical protein [Stylosanthes scabra]